MLIEKGIVVNLALGSVITGAPNDTSPSATVLYLDGQGSS